MPSSRKPITPAELWAYWVNNASNGADSKRLNPLKAPDPVTNAPSPVKADTLQADYKKILPPSLQRN